MPFKQAPLDCLIRAYPSPPTQKAVGKSPESYLREMAGGAQLISKLQELGYNPYTVKNRDEVRDVCTNPKVDVLAAYAVAMAWGGQRYNNFDSSVKSTDLPGLLTALRSSSFNRVQAYAFAAEHCTKIYGLNISFFTKLLFFFRPKADAYILDRWTAQSIFLLCEKPPIRLGSLIQDDQQRCYRPPHSKTNSDEYGKFCLDIESLCAALKWPKDSTGSQAETAIFDKGGEERWRTYVLSCFNPDGTDESIKRISSKVGKASCRKELVTLERLRKAYPEEYE